MEILQQAISRLELSQVQVMQEFTNLNAAFLNSSADTKEILSKKVVPMSYVILSSLFSFDAYMLYWYQ